MLRLSNLSVHLSLLFHLLNFLLRKFNFLTFLLLIFQLCFVCVLLIRLLLTFTFSRFLVPSPLSTSSFSPFSTSSSLSILPDFVLFVIASYKRILSFPQGTTNGDDRFSLLFHLFLSVAAFSVKLLKLSHSGMLHFLHHLSSFSSILSNYLSNFFTKSVISEEIHCFYF